MGDTSPREAPRESPREAPRKPQESPKTEVARAREQEQEINTLSLRAGTPMRARDIPTPTPDIPEAATIRLARPTPEQAARFPGFRPAAPYPQTPREVIDAAEARGLAMPEAEAEAFLDHFQGRGWVDAQGQPIVDWRCSLRRWMRRATETTTQTGGKTHAAANRPGAGNALRYVGGRAEPSYDYSRGGGLTEADLDALLGLGPRPAGAGGA